MSQKDAILVINLINKKTPWVSWDEKSRRLLVGALSPMIGLTGNEKGGTAAQWEASRLARRLFQVSQVPLPSFIYKQWDAIPIPEKKYWEQAGKTNRKIILQNIKLRTSSE